jgi:ribose-phosphate pyrophosphokinase
VAIFFPLPGNESLAAELARLTGGVPGEIEVRRFPDGETYVRAHSPVAGRHAILVCTLARPDEKFLPLIFAARAIRDLAAASVRLVAPYLPYLRQDRIFQPGEALTSLYFAGLVSNAFDGLVTVDPHLHRYRSLAEVYGVETRVVHAAPLLAAWIAGHVERPLVLGPDAESEQWVAEIARLAGAPSAVFGKARIGDRDIRLTMPDLARWRGFQPVLVDDIVSSGTTLFEAATRLLEAGFAAPACLAIHALFGDEVAVRLAKVSSLVSTTDTILHPTNRFAVAPLIARALGGPLDRPEGTEGSVRSCASQASDQGK